MKLNYDCIRDSLLLLESINYIEENSEGDIEFNEVDISRIYESLPQYNHEDIYYALFNLEQAGLISTSEFDAENSVYMFCVNYITYSGHEFLERIKPLSVWNKTKGILSKVGAISVEIIIQVASNVLTNLLTNQM